MIDLQSILFEIDALKARLDTLRPISSAQLQQAQDIEYTFESNRIEGNTLTLRETDLVVNKGLTVGGKSMREHLEAINHYDAVLYIRELAQEPTPLGEPELHTIHPFIDGNGRTARLVMNLVLLQHGYPIVNIPGDTQSRLGYYNALEESNLTGNNAGFVKLVAHYALRSLQSWLKSLGV